MLMFQPLRKYADFSGRARRAEYWLFSLFISIVYVVLFGLVATMGGISANGGGGGGAVLILSLVLSVFALGMFIPSLAVLFRRLHDINLGAAWALLLFVPFVGGLAIFVMSLIDGTPGPNKYGEDPKQRAAVPVATAPATVEIHNHYSPPPPEAS